MPDAVWNTITLGARRMYDTSKFQNWQNLSESLQQLCNHNTNIVLRGTSAHTHTHTHTHTIYLNLSTFILYFIIMGNCFKILCLFVNGGKRPLEVFLEGLDHFYIFLFVWSLDLDRGFKYNNNWCEEVRWNNEYCFKLSKVGKLVMIVQNEYSCGLNQLPLSNVWVQPFIGQHCVCVPPPLLCLPHCPHC